MIRLFQFAPAFGLPNASPFCMKPETYLRTWPACRSSWVESTGWAKTRETFFGAMPVPLRWFVPALARRGLRAELRGHGMGLPGQPAVGPRRFTDPAPRAVPADAGGRLPTHEGAVLRVIGNPINDRTRRPCPSA